MVYTCAKVYAAFVVYRLLSKSCQELQLFGGSEHGTDRLPMFANRLLFTTGYSSLRPVQAKPYQLGLCS